MCPPCVHACVCVHYGALDIVKKKIAGGPSSLEIMTLLSQKSMGVRMGIKKLQENYDAKLFSSQMLILLHFEISCPH